MASVPVSINGVLWDHTTKTGRPVTIVGEGYLTGVGIGGGPMPGGPPLGIWGGGGVGNYPDQSLPVPQPGQPPQIWGGPYQPPFATTGPGFPTNPIVLPPVVPGGPPLQIWGPIGNYPDAGFPGPQPGGPVYPSHPIVIPPLPPEPPEGVKPPPENGGWGYVEPYGWGYFPMGGGAGPKT